MTARALRLVLVAASVLALLLSAAGATHDAVDTAPSGVVRATSWVWPVAPSSLVRPFDPPADPYGPGHRGVDLQSSPGASIRAVAAGMVVFAGWVVDRPVISIDHGGGVVSSVEPVVALVAVGETVAPGSAIGVIAPEGHGAAGRIHFGVRVHGVYVDPLSLLPAPARAVLLPCC
ncbi:M23 family metallopeptidase [Microbacterium chocolatum]|uniref:murein hydrolase activator EnvC family protein n=1 Tax=Microbacterium aurantiacum TaxID=162393 RepID=UPI0033906ED8